jgi:hypothetical protein
MATCPNINLNSWKKLVASKGEDLAYYLWDKYEGVVPKDVSVQEEVTTSPKTIALIKDFIKRIGVDIKSVKDISVNGVKQDANGVALIMQKLIQVVEGKEDTTLPEEAMHFAVEILQQTDPALFNKLLNEINGYRILNEVFATYGGDPLYQTKDGKPDVLKLKKEAIGKVLAEVVSNKAEGLSETSDNLAKVQSWWRTILDALKRIFQKSGFDTAAMKVLSGESFGTVEDIRAEEQSIFLQKSTSQEAVYNKLKDIQSKITKDDSGYYIDGKKVPRRVTDLVKDWYERRFKANDLTKSDYAKAVDDLKAEKGTAGHADIEHAFSLFVDEDGFLRDEPLDDSSYVSKLNPRNRDMYDILKKNLQERLNSFPVGTRFMSEVMVYDAKRGLAGTVDFLAITPDGKMNILDWKFMDLNVDKYEDVPWYKVNAWREQMDQYKIILQNVYGVRPQDFQQTRMIPIKAFYSPGNAKTGALPQLQSIEIGDVNIKNIAQDYLIPVGLEGESTGNEKIDALLEKLNAVYKRISEKKALPSEKLSKAEQLNSLFTAIRQLQMKQNLKPLLRQAKILNKEIQKTIDRYKTNWVGKDPKDFKQKDISNFYEELETAKNSLIAYTTLNTDLKFLFQRELSEEDEALKKELSNVTESAQEIDSDIDNISGKFVRDFVAGSEGVENYLSPEKVIKGFTKWFVSTTGLQLKGLETLYKKANRAFGFASMDTIDETKKLGRLKEAYDKWTQAKGLNNKNYFDILKKKDKNELIDEFQREFYKELKSKSTDRDFTWVKENIDVAAYNKFLKEKLA